MGAVMRPDARISAAIEILDAIFAGTPGEQALVNWARKSRFAGSSDRAAIRDLVFEALRRKRSDGWLGGGETGRGLMLGRVRRLGEEYGAVFSGQGHAPAPVTPEEIAGFGELAKADVPVRLDCPNWLWPVLQAGYGDQAEAILTTMQSRAPIFVRVNAARTSRADVLAALAQEGIEVHPAELAETAIQITSGERRLRGTEAYQDGLIELQDAASQASVLLAKSHLQGERVLDYCAGGGGKALAFAALGCSVQAHDVNTTRMKDLPERAARAGVQIDQIGRPKGTYDMVFCDAPCSGSGAWRRQPEAKWAMTQDRLEELCAIQDSILSKAHGLVRPGGVLAYATCSLLPAENGQRIEAFLKQAQDWQVLETRQWTPLDGADGFFLSLLRKP